MAAQPNQHNLVTACWPRLAGFTPRTVTPSPQPSCRVQHHVAPVDAGTSAVTDAAPAVACCCFSRPSAACSATLLSSSSPAASHARSTCCSGLPAALPPVLPARGCGICCRRGRPAAGDAQAMAVCGSSCCCSTVNAAGAAHQAAAAPLLVLLRRRPADPAVTADTPSGLASGSDRQVQQARRSSTQPGW